MADWNELHKTFDIGGPDKRFVEFAEEYLKPGMRVLDLGCGRGRHSLYCARKGIETHAVDISETGLEVLKREAEKGQLFELLKTAQADIKELPFPDGYFDAIICVNVINHGYKRDIEAYFKEATRVLKPGGYFFLVLAPPEFVDDVRAKNTTEPEKNTFLNIDMPDGDVPHHLIDDAELKQLLKGYDILKTEKHRRRSHWKDIMVVRKEVIARKK